MIAKRLVAHRGYPRHYPENTLLGMSKAIEARAKFIETDILFSADQQPERLGQAFVGEHITPLSALVGLLSEHPNVTAFIELKRTGLETVGIENAYRIVTEILNPVIGQCVLISFSDEFIQYAHEQQFPRLGVVLKDWQDRQGPWITDIQPEFIFCDTDKVPEGATLDDLQSTVVVYEVEDPDQAIDWFNRGADMVETFDIGSMITNLAHRAL